MKIVLLLAVSLATPAGGSSFYSGNALNEVCRDPTKEVFLLGFVAGASDALNATAPYMIQDFVAACVPEGATAGQLRDVTCSYLEKRPDIRHFPAAGLILGALREAFPCQK